MENIKIYSRVKPVSSNVHTCVSVERDVLNIWDPTILVSRWNQNFVFDHCFAFVPTKLKAASSQEEVFDEIGRSAIDCAQQGINCSILAYGQTGAGKSYTMIGPIVQLHKENGISSTDIENLGLIPRIAFGLFELMNHQMGDSSKRGSTNCSIEFSFFEIYNEKIRDLLVDKNVQFTNRIIVRENASDGVLIDGLTRYTLTSFAQFLELFYSRGVVMRHTGQSHLNHDHSSRSHAIVILTLHQREFDHDVVSDRTSKIVLVDLAGSERINTLRPHAEVLSPGMDEKTRRQESININQSLSTLCDVVHQLTSRKNGGKVSSFRNSNLTRILKDSLGGTSRTMIIANINPSSEHYQETLSTLRFVQRAKMISNRPTVNNANDWNGVEEVVVQQLRDEIVNLKDQLALALEANRRLSCDDGENDDESQQQEAQPRGKQSIVEGISSIFDDISISDSIANPLMVLATELAQLKRAVEERESFVGKILKVVSERKSKSREEFVEEQQVKAAVVVDDETHDDDDDDGKVIQDDDDTKSPVNHDMDEDYDTGFDERLHQLTIQRQFKSSPFIQPVKESLKLIHNRANSQKASSPAKSIVSQSQTPIVHVSKPAVDSSSSSSLLGIADEEAVAVSRIKTRTTTKPVVSSPIVRHSQPVASHFTSSRSSDLNVRIEQPMVIAANVSNRSARRKANAELGQFIGSMDSLLSSVKQL